MSIILLMSIYVYLCLLMSIDVNGYLIRSDDTQHSSKHSSTSSIRQPATWTVQRRISSCLQKIDVK